MRDNLVFGNNILEKKSSLLLETNGPPLERKHENTYGKPKWHTNAVCFALLNYNQ